MDPKDIYRSFYATAAAYTFFTRANGTFLKINHSLGHKINLKEFRKIKIISSMFSEHNGMKPRINK